MISEELYNKILNVMPITGAEAMITDDESILFVKRKNAPAKGEWWFPGGRIRKGESFEDALHREVKEETGIEVQIVKFIGVYNRIFPDRHDITLAFLCKTATRAIILNSEHSECKFYSELPADLHPFLIKVIRDSGWRFKD